MEESNKCVSMSNVNNRLHRIIQDKHAPKNIKNKKNKK
jgi:uncharacterized protein (UPF0147 family)